MIRIKKYKKRDKDGRGRTRNRILVFHREVEHIVKSEPILSLIANIVVVILDDNAVSSADSGHNCDNRPHYYAAFV